MQLKCKEKAQSNFTIFAAVCHLLLPKNFTCENQTIKSNSYIIFDIQQISNI